MSTFSTRVKSGMAWAWTHTAAGVAVVLFFSALVIGYNIGRPASDPAPILASGAHDHTENAPGAQQMFTCSMHPSVRLPDPDARCPICFMELIPVRDEGGEGNRLRISMSESAAARSRIETVAVAEFFPTAEVSLYGKVTYDETSVARLTAYFPGRIERLFVNYLGVPISMSDHMAEIYSPDLLAAFEELRQSVAANRGTGGTSGLLRAATQDTLTATREKLRLFGVTPDQIAAIEDGSFDSDYLTIYAPIEGVVTHLAVREGDYVQTGSPIATIADLTRLWLDMEAYESQLPLLRWGQRVSFTVEAHPGETFEGRISFIEPIIDDRTRTAAVRVAVDNTERRLKPGMFASAVVRTQIGPDGAIASNEFAGRWVSPMHPTIVKDDPGQCDICGMEMVPAETLGMVGDPSAVTEPLVIPRSAVLFTGTRSVVYVEVPDVERPTYEGRSVVLGPRAGEFYVVRDGLSRGEMVVVNGAFRIDSAMQIAAKPSMMTPGGGGGTNPHAGHGGMDSGPSGGPMTETPMEVAVPENFVLALTPVFTAYLEAQESLAADDLGGFTRATTALETALHTVEEAELRGDPLAAWRRAEALLGLDLQITTIEAARERFEQMSEGAIVLQRRFGHRGGEGLSLAHCPMAFEFEGADWLQRGDQINNPYFGDTMLRCGEIIESFAPDVAPRGEASHEEHGVDGHE